MKKIRSSAIILVATVLILSTFAFAQPQQVPAIVTKTPEPVPVVIPEHAVEVADDVFLLGPTIVNGKAVEGYMFIDRVDAFHHRTGHNGGPGGQGGGGSTCFTELAKSFVWKSTEQYVLNTANTDGMNDSFVAYVIETSLNTWDDEVAFDIFGSRDTASIVDGADTVSPDGKNEILFAPIDSPGAIAATTVWGVFRGPPSGREIVEFDMVFDDTDFDFGDAALNPALMDLQSIATHEDGHALGLGHPIDDCTEETMYRFASEGETKKRDLNTGDIAGINSLYP